MSIRGSSPSLILPRSVSLASERNEGAQSGITQEETAPQHDTQQNGPKAWIADAQMGRDGTAKVARLKDRSEDRCSGNQVHDDTRDFEDAQPKRDVHLVAQMVKTR